ncbi:MAG: peptide chain release factor N(5)-glutamine methyltransferase [Planctomycetota bacterium]|nr:peptide chain release factor N(5)-glutamine methyltransferase [Planctomycetota bacterium]
MTHATPKGPPAPRTAREVLDRSQHFLAQRGLPGARREAELLVANAIGLDRLGLYLELDRPLDKDELDRAREAVLRRSKGEPAAYILGRREFYGRSFAVRPGVLIPRPETELLVDRARELVEELIVEGTDEPRLADLGTGSGCIAITMLLECPTTRVLALDLSPEAVEIAGENAKALEVPTERFGLRCGDAFEGLAALAPGGVDLLLSNPPYIDPRVGDELAADVRAHEPALALFAPDGDPDHWARRLMQERERLLSPGGRALVELGFDQAPRLEALAAASGLEVRIHPDLEGIPRLLEFGR